MNILIIKHGSLGDLIVSFGAMKTLRENYQNNNIYLLTQSNYKKTFKYALKNYQSISKKGRSHIKKNYSSDLMCRKTLEVYNQLINS